MSRRQQVPPVLCRVVDLMVDGERVTAYVRGGAGELTEAERAVLVELVRRMRDGPAPEPPRTA